MLAGAAQPESTTHDVAASMLAGAARAESTTHDFRELLMPNLGLESYQIRGAT